MQDVPLSAVDRQLNADVQPAVESVFGKLRVIIASIELNARGDSVTLTSNYNQFTDNDV